MTAQDRYPRSGIAKVVRALYDELSVSFPDRSILGFHRPGAPTATFPARRHNLAEQTAKVRGYSLLPQTDVWLEFGLPLAAALNRIDVLHCPCNTMPSFSSVPVVITLHDLIPLEFEEYASRPDVKRWAKGLPKKLARARRVVVSSEYVRRKVCEWQPKLLPKIRVARWGPTLRPVACTPANLARLRHRLLPAAGQPYLLAFGSAHPHKNIRRLIDAWAGIAEDVGRKAFLLIVGIDENARQALLQHETRPERLGSCVLRGAVAEEDLPALLQNALGLCYPSLSEGFGLPLLEAFACGCPVAASSVTSIPEVGGDAVDYFEPRSHVSIQASLRRLVSDAGWRQELSARGSERLKLFSWREAAEAFDVGSD